MCPRRTAPTYRGKYKRKTTAAARMWANGAEKPTKCRPISRILYAGGACAAAIYLGRGLRHGSNGLPTGIKRATFSGGGLGPSYPSPAYLAFQPPGFTAPAVARRGRGLLPHAFTLAGPGVCRGLGGLLSVALSVGPVTQPAFPLRSGAPCAVRTFLSPTKRGSGSTACISSWG